jgi:hypothetical protein
VPDDLQVESEIRRSIVVEKPAGERRDRIVRHSLTYRLVPPLWDSRLFETSGSTNIATCDPHPFSCNVAVVSFLKTI